MPYFSVRFNEFTFYCLRLIVNLGSCIHLNPEEMTVQIFYTFGTENETFISPVGDQIHNILHPVYV